MAPGGTTTDGMFTLEDAECLALCGNAPCLTVNWRFFGDVGPGRFDQLVERPAGRPARRRGPAARDPVARRSYRRAHGPGRQRPRRRRTARCLPTAPTRPRPEPPASGPQPAAQPTAGAPRQAADGRVDHRQPAAPDRRHRPRRRRPAGVRAEAPRVTTRLTAHDDAPAGSAARTAAPTGSGAQAAQATTTADQRTGRLMTVTDAPRIVTRRLGKPRSLDPGDLSGRRRLRGSAQGAVDDARADPRAGQHRQHPRPRRRRLRGRPQVGDAGQADAGLPRPSTATRASRRRSRTTC